MVNRVGTTYSSSILKTATEIPDETKSTDCTYGSQSLGQTFEIKIPTELLALTSYPIEIAQKWLTLTGKVGRVHKYPLQTILPKVQMVKIVPKRMLPRDVEVDRRRKEYAKINLLQLLENANITNKDLLPTEEQYSVLSETAFKHFLPISFFDNSDFDSLSQEAWLELGNVEEGVYPIPARVFLPKEQSLIDYKWQYASVYHYNKSTNLWVCMALEDENTYLVSKIQIMFLAENPRLFVERLKSAIQLRDKAENVMLMDNIIDNLLMERFRNDNFRTENCIEKFAEKCKRGPIFEKMLRRELYLIYEHLMAINEFEMFTKLLPKEFPQFKDNIIQQSLPELYHTVRAEKEAAIISKLSLRIQHCAYRLKQLTLFYNMGGIEAMLNVAVECRFIETMNIFTTNISKALPLNDFLTTQNQVSTTLGNYVKINWPQKIETGIIIVLRPLGKGWLDITLGNFDVYLMCKISKFIQQVRYRMESSMQTLLETNMKVFIHFLTQPCRQFLSLTSDYKWPPNDFINTPFPYFKPIFSLVIGISDMKKVFYSTNPTEFAPSMKELFKKSLEKTSGVRYIDAETMTNLRFAPNLYILTVELVEELYIKQNDWLMECYTKAVIPLNAYAKPFDRFIPFYTLNIQDYMDKYNEAKKPSVQVKRDILEYKRQKQEIRRILPGNITIGPFLIYVEPLKQFLIKKYIEIIRKLFEYYIERMYNTNFALYETCQNVYNKINNRPQSIEHLYEIRDFGETLPDTVEDLRADIQIMWLEYDLLDNFFYNLNDVQFNMKWEVFGMPHKILNRLITLREEQKIDIEEFRRIHQSELINFSERLESLNEEVQAFSLEFDPEKVVETAVDVKKTWKIITDLQKTGQTLQMRQVLFEMEDLSLEFLDSIIVGFVPYKTLWFSCYDFDKLLELAIGNPIATVDIDEVWKTVETLAENLRKCVDTFSEKPEVQEVAFTYLKKIDEFIPIHNCIKWLKNEHWLLMHWMELCNRGNIEIKYNSALNFSYCMRKGIMNHLDIVQEISEKAEFEADELRRQEEEAIRRAEEEAQAILIRKQNRKARTDIL